jgi:hypothetical protein
MIGKITAMTALNRCSVICAVEFAAKRPQLASGTLGTDAVSALDKFQTCQDSVFLFEVYQSVTSGKPDEQAVRRGKVGVTRPDYSRYEENRRHGVDRDVILEERWHQRYRFIVYFAAWKNV